MGAIKQYLDLYADQKSIIDANSTASMNSMRDTALHALEGKELPDKSVEGFEKTSIDEMMAPDYGINIQRIDIPADVAGSFHCGVPNLSTLLGVVVNDEFHPIDSLKKRLPEGCIFTSLKDADKVCPEILGRYYGKIADIKAPGVALNTLLAQNGVLIYVPKGLKLEKPLQLVNIFNSPVPTMAFRRLLIVLEDGASAQILLCDHTQEIHNSYMASQVIEIALGENSSLDLCDIEESSNTTSRYSQMYAIQNQRSRLSINGTTLLCGTTRNEYNVKVEGHECDTMISGMAIASKKQHIDNNTLVTHLGTHCRSNQLFKYVLDEEASGAFEGTIFVDEKAKFTEAYQNDKNLLAAGSAKMHCKPQLLIYCDDVKCSHGASTGQLDMKALFYMRSRGIDEKLARTMLMQAFMADVIDTVSLPGLKERLHLLVEKRFENKDLSCGSCNINCKEA